MMTAMTASISTLMEWLCDCGVVEPREIEGPA
jgi:hypothetical protein